MSKTKSKGPNNAGIMVLGVFALAVVGGLAVYVQRSPASAIPPEQLRPEHRPKPTLDKPQSRTEPEVVVFSPRFEKEKLSFDRATRAVPAGEDPMVFAVNEYLSVSNIADTGAKLLSVSVEEGVATLNFSSAFAQGQGSMDEGTLIEGIQRTMGQFSGIEKLVFEAEGAPIDTLGHLELSEPVPVLR